MKHKLQQRVAMLTNEAEQVTATPAMLNFMPVLCMHVYTFIRLCRFFKRSGLPKEVLAKVWDLANSSRAGMQQQQHLTAKQGRMRTLVLGGRASSSWHRSSCQAAAQLC